LGSLEGKGVIIMTHIESYIKMLTESEIEYKVTHETRGGTARTVVTINDTDPDPESEIEDSVSMEFDKTTGKLEFHYINTGG
jgi:hypothetical protein